MALEIEVESVKKQVDIYRQLRDQLLEDMKRYRRQGKDDLASIISQTVAA